VAVAVTQWPGIGFPKRTSRFGHWGEWQYSLQANARSVVRLATTCQETAMLGFRCSFGRIMGRCTYTSGLIGLLLGGLVLSGCAPTPGSTLPPATIIAPGPTLQPRPTEAYPATALAAPTAAHAETPRPEPTVPPRHGIELTVLHTNDVMGEIDPCG